MTMSAPNLFEGELAPAEGRTGQYRCVDLWLADGSIILQADNIMFKVYSGLLARHSPFFRTLFTLPQPTTDVEEYDGVPVVQMQDGANELRWLLLAEHDTSSSLINTNTKIKILLSLLHLSTKYEVPHTRKAVVSVLESLFPPKLADWIETLDHTVKLVAVQTDKTVWEVDIANAARANSVPQILPHVLFICLTHGLGRVLDGFQYNVAHLSPENRRAAVLAFPALLEQCRTVGFQFLQEHLRPVTMKRCNTPEKCRLVRLKGAEMMEKDVAYKPGEFNRTLALCHFDTATPYEILQFMEGEGYCAECTAQDKAMCDDNRTKLWEMLPGIFGLPSWEILVQDQLEGTV